jgi:hypothetical protein
LGGGPEHAAEAGLAGADRADVGGRGEFGVDREDAGIVRTLGKTKN